MVLVIAFRQNSYIDFPFGDTVDLTTIENINAATTMRPGMSRSTGIRFEIRCMTTALNKTDITDHLFQNASGQFQPLTSLHIDRQTSQGDHRKV